MKIDLTHDIFFSSLFFFSNSLKAKYLTEYPTTNVAGDFNRQSKYSQLYNKKIIRF